MRLNINERFLWPKKRFGGHCQLLTIEQAFGCLLKFFGTCYPQMLGAIVQFCAIVIASTKGCSITCRWKYRYQLTPYTIEMERMVIGLENLGEGFGGSLERTLFDRLLQGLVRLTGQTEGTPGYNIFNESDEGIHIVWQDLYQDFRKLTENAIDYLAHLQSEKVEEKMMTEAFFWSIKRRSPSTCAISCKVFNARLSGSRGF